MLPFSLTLPQEPKTTDSMTEDELNSKIERSYEQSLAKEGVEFTEAFDKILGSR